VPDDVRRRDAPHEVEVVDHRHLLHALVGHLAGHERDRGVGLRRDDRPVGQVRHGDFGQCHPGLEQLADVPAEVRLQADRHHVGRHQVADEHACQLVPRRRKRV
jgi:hypothetical protein